MSALGRAVRADHPCADRSCDIAVSLGLGLDVVAAWLLISAADSHPETARAIEGERIAVPADIRAHPQWREWTAYAARYGRACGACGTVTCGAPGFTPDRCGGCLAPLEGDRRD